MKAMPGLQPITRQTSGEAKPFPADLLNVDGMLGMFVAECLRSAPERRQPVYALAGALATVGALAGRRYQSPTELRTNVYAAIIGGSSSGKGHCMRVAKSLLRAAGLERYLAGDARSGAAMQSELVEHPVNLAVIDEFGIWLAGITNERAPSHLVEIRKRLMTLFSDANSTVAGLSYANPAERARRDIIQPHLCMLGAGTPDRFFAALQSGALRDGFVPRLLVFRPDQELPPLVNDPQPLVITEGMIAAARTIAGVNPGGGNLAEALRMSHDVEPDVMTVPYSADGMAQHSRWLRRREDVLQAGCPGYAAPELVGKWSEHAIKLALIHAVSRDPLSPVLDASSVSWGWRLSDWCIAAVSSMAGRHMADNRAEADLKRVLNVIVDAGNDGILKRDVIQKTRFLDVKTRDQILMGLADGGDVLVEKLPAGPEGGRPAYRYRKAA